MRSIDLHELMTGEKPKTDDERMREGQSAACGIAGAMKMRQDYEKPWHLQTHRPTRGRSDDA